MAGMGEDRWWETGQPGGGACPKGETWGERTVRVIAESEVMKELMKRLKISAASGGATLISGERGTEKEMLARYIHTHGGRKERPFLAVNCGALPPKMVETELFGGGGEAPEWVGAFERAEGGTVLLNEVETLPMPAQLRLSRLLRDEAGPCALGQVHVIAATSADLGRMVEDGGFSKELFYLLNVISVCVPPIRKRKEDILPICQYYLECFGVRYGEKKRFTRGAQMALERYQWPGNMFEIKNTVERAFLMAHTDTISVGDLPEVLLLDGQDGTPQEAALERAELSDLLQKPYKEALRSFERLYLTEMLHRFNGNITQTAKALNISRSNLYYRLQGHFPDTTKDTSGKE